MVGIREPYAPLEVDETPTRARYLPVYSSGARNAGLEGTIKEAMPGH